MDPEKQAMLKKEGRVLIVNLIKLCGALYVVAFFWGGANTRAWMLAFLSGTLTGLSGVHADSTTPASIERAPLKLLGHGCHRESMYQVCEGEVRNETLQPLENVMAEVRFTDRDGTFIKAASSIIDYQPLMPGQTSAFKVITTSNPQIWHYSFGFREMFGGAIKAAR